MHILAECQKWKVIFSFYNENKGLIQKYRRIFSTIVSEYLVLNGIPQKQNLLSD